jgi:hypothetical protein
MRNYLIDALKGSKSVAEKDDINLENIDLQLKMLAYQTLDLFDEK